MRRISGTLLALAFWAMVYLALRGISVYLLSRPNLDSIAFGGCATLCLTSLLYERPGFKARLRRRSGIAGAVLIGGFTTILVGYAHYLTARSLALHRHFSEDQPKLLGRLHQSDTIYGYRPVKGGRARVVMFPGDTLAYYRDADGFRVPVSDTLKANRPGEVDVIFFGCSFTEGAACAADSTYPHLVARALGLRYINAGVSSWGLSQMYLLARETLPKYKPRYAVFQYSPWLSERGLAPFKYGTEVPMPKPFFEPDAAGRFTLRKPPYASHVFDMDRDAIHGRYKGRFAAFLFDVGIPFLLREDRLRMGMRWAILRGRLRPADNDTRHQTRLSRQIYPELLELARANGTTPLIVYIPSFVADSRAPDSTVLSTFDRRIIAPAPDAHRAYLESHPGCRSPRDFIHWRVVNGDSIRVDIHPNPLSHRLIAAALIGTLKGNGMSDAIPLAADKHAHNPRPNPMPQGRN